jgi:hypothetical protein
MKASMYYHVCCVGVPQQDEGENNAPATDPPNEVDHPVDSNTDMDKIKYASFHYRKSKHILDSDKRSLSDSNLTLKQLPIPTVREHSKSSFFQKMGLQKNDVEIIEVQYLLFNFDRT